MGSVYLTFNFDFGITYVPEIPVPWFLLKLWDYNYALLGVRNLLSNIGDMDCSVKFSIVWMPESERTPS